MIIITDNVKREIDFKITSNVHLHGALCKAKELKYTIKLDCNVILLYAMLSWFPDTVWKADKANDFSFFVTYLCAKDEYYEKTSLIDRIK
jgi:hypothetical protein